MLITLWTYALEAQSSTLVLVNSRPLFTKHSLIKSRIESLRRVISRCYNNACFPCVSVIRFNSILTWMTSHLTLYASQKERCCALIHVCQPGRGCVITAPMIDTQLYFVAYANIVWALIVRVKHMVQGIFDVLCLHMPKDDKDCTAFDKLHGFFCRHKPMECPVVRHCSRASDLLPHSAAAIEATRSSLRSWLFQCKLL